MTFLRMNGRVHGHILNIIEGDDDDPTLRFAFTLAIEGEEHGGEAEQRYERDLREGLRHRRPGHARGRARIGAHRGEPDARARRGRVTERPAGERTGRTDPLPGRDLARGGRRPGAAARPHDGGRHADRARRRDPPDRRRRDLRRRLPPRVDRDGPGADRLRPLRQAQRRKRLRAVPRRVGPDRRRCAAGVDLRPHDLRRSRSAPLVLIRLRRRQRRSARPLVVGGRLRVDVERA